jgi:hypothetical protein
MKLIIHLLFFLIGCAAAGVFFASFFTFAVN